MRLAFILAVMAAPAYAEAWSSWLVGENTDGGNLSITVETKADARAVNAGLKSDDPSADVTGISVECFNDETQMAEPMIDTSIAITGPLAKVKDLPIKLFASFDDGSPVALGAFSFQSMHLQAPLHPKVIALLATHKKMKLWSEKGEISTTLSLKNAGAALAGLQCWGDKIQ